MGPLESVKPLLRGRFHEAAAFVSLGACLMLITRASSRMMIFAVGIYSLSLICLLTVSALYHRINWKPAARAVMRRLDHAAIFVLIGGTMTPIFLIALPNGMGHAPLAAIWALILVGILQTIFWIRAPKWLAALLYVGVGWIPVYYFTELGQALGGYGVGLILAGGIVYTLGAVIYALKSPNPWPRVFGYHEIFHIFVVIAAVLHFCVINDLIA
ncbi:MAG: hemolysin III family protein [Bdellovibrionaceae bacterium]|nr:hemolysin III family protein [Pseudobdellovibrionaceae bacterium]